MRSESTVMVSVLIIAGSIEAFSVVYSHANREGLRLGIPLIRI